MCGLAGVWFVCELVGGLSAYGLVDAAEGQNEPAGGGEALNVLEPEGDVVVTGNAAAATEASLC